MRLDRFINNDSGSILPSWILPKVIADDRENDFQFVAKHQAILQELVGDDSFIARVVVTNGLSTVFLGASENSYDSSRSVLFASTTK